jgi:hypothetical protein
MSVSVVSHALVSLLRHQHMVTAMLYWRTMLEVDIMVKYPLMI